MSNSISGFEKRLQAVEEFYNVFIPYPDEAEYNTKAEYENEEREYNNGIELQDRAYQQLNEDFWNWMTTQLGWNKLPPNSKEALIQHAMKLSKDLDFRDVYEVTKNLNPIATAIRIDLQATS